MNIGIRYGKLECMHCVYAHADGFQGQPYKQTTIQNHDFAQTAETVGLFA